MATGNLGALVEGKPSGNDFYPPPILDPDPREIKVPEENIGLDTRAALMAQYSSHALHSTTSLDQSARPTARSTMVTVVV